MESAEVSLHQLMVYEAVKNSTGWITNKDIAKLSGVNERTARAHVYKLVNLEVFEQAEVYPGHRYRLSEKAKKRKVAYLDRLDQARKVFGDLTLKDFA
jgi:DNA-binding IclR family transcriptional regulator